MSPSAVDGMFSEQEQRGLLAAFDDAQDILQGHFDKVRREDGPDGALVTARRDVMQWCISQRSGTWTSDKLLRSPRRTKILDALIEQYDDVPGEWQPWQA